ncbi:MAG TPA: RluA family pseudouridine synthase [Thermoanaerobaculia bacterium]|jgi:23S rRNA pseudouridine1911/1915/1917 synthase|nr:RluA family pseudouridine synthase [Thermoanaerobaculia bacterium]
MPVMRKRPRKPKPKPPTVQAPGTEIPTLAARVREAEPGLSWRAARERIAAGCVTVDGRVEREAAFRPEPESRIEIAAARPGGAPSVPAIRIVHSDPDVAVVVKPAGILTVPYEDDDRDTLIALTRVALRRREAAKGNKPNLTLRAVQRLDKETSGLVVFARNIPAQRKLQEQLGEHAALRRYLALAEGTVEAADIESWLVEDRGDGLRGSWRGPGGPPREAKRAATRIRPIERLAGATLVECELETGRTHQIRIHLAEDGHPLVGEKVYIRDARATKTPRIVASRPMLHAAELGFDHPHSGARLQFEEPPPEDFLEILDRLRLGRKGGR